MKRFLLLIVIALVFSPAILVRSQRSSKDQPVGYWEGKIRVEKTYDGKQGRYKWIAEYRVLLGEEQANSYSRTSELNPLELDYTIEADLDLDKDNYGVYRGSGVNHGKSRAWRILGKASGQLWLDSSVRAKNVITDPDRVHQSRLGGGVNHYESLPEYLVKWSYESNNYDHYERGVSVCNHPRSYNISINLTKEK